MYSPPQDPQCKFSRAVIQILNTVKYVYFLNFLDPFLVSDSVIRAALPSFSIFPVADVANTVELVS